MRLDLLGGVGGSTGSITLLATCLAVFLPVAGQATESSCDKTALRSGAQADFASVIARAAATVVKLVTIGPERHAVEESDGVGSETAVDGLPVAAHGGLRQSAWLERSSASGFIIDPQGYILTSAHAVRDVREVWISLPSQQRLLARIVGQDRRTDVALLKVDTHDLASASIGRATALCPGEWVAAVGAPFGFEQSVAAGVVSAYPRFMPGASVPMIQTDVALNPGSSGSPLFNLRGEVVGMNSMVYSSTGGYIGISFALPIDIAMRIAAEIRATGKVTRGRIGASVQPVTPELARAFGLEQPLGALVVRVDPASPASASGLRAGDIVLSVNGEAPASYAALHERIASARPGERLDIHFWRSRASHRVKMAVVEEETPAFSTSADSGSAQEDRLGLGLAEGAPKEGEGASAGLHVVSADGAAARAGVQPGDRILAVNETYVSRISSFDAALAVLRHDVPVALLVVRGTTMRFVPVGRPGARIPIGE
jgi:serine protease Do